MQIARLLVCEQLNNWPSCTGKKKLPFWPACVYKNFTISCAFCSDKISLIAEKEDNDYLDEWFTEVVQLLNSTFMSFLRHEQKLGYMTTLIVLIMITKMIALISPVYKCPKLQSENEYHANFNTRRVTTE